MMKWTLGALLSIVLLFGGAQLSSLSDKDTLFDQRLYEQSQAISTLQEAMKQQVEIQRETRDAIKELRDAFVQSTKRNNR